MTSLQNTETAHHHGINTLTLAGILVTMGIVYGDIGTSPLYVMRAIVGEGRSISTDLVFGGVSCVFWTLTLQTTIKYILITLRADNNGEGGIFSLYSLVRRQRVWLLGVAILGGAALLADGIITPPISVSSAVEGLRLINPDIQTVPIVIVILSFMFFFQRFGTATVGKLFGPVMLVWFSMLGTLGTIQLLQNPEILKAFNPYYAFNLLYNIPGGFWLLGAVFLCTTGAESIYSDLGHCGRKNIQYSWIFVKICLLLNYFGQGAWLLNHQGKTLDENPFFAIMPEWFLSIGIGIATLATIIASQALISGSFTLVGEAIRLHLSPKLQVIYPSTFKGQIYIPAVNTLMYIGCVTMVLIFRESANMEAAYGLALIMTMMMTTILLVAYLRMKGLPKWLVAFLFVMFMGTEIAFLIANLKKFMHGGYVSLLTAMLIMGVMIICARAQQIKRRLTDKVKIKHYLDQLVELSHDTTVPKYATNLVFLSAADKPDEVEQKILYSILQKQPKRSDIYWFVHINVTDMPDTLQYKVDILAPGDVVRIDFYLGFRVEQRINVYLRQVVENMIKNGEIDVVSRYSSLRGRNIAGDFRFIILEEYLSSDNDLPLTEQFVMNGYTFLKSFAGAPERWFGLDTSVVNIEKVPLVVRPVERVELERIYPDDQAASA